MDLNELFFRHQVAHMRADRIADPGERHRLGLLAEGFATRIAALQQSLGARPTRVMPVAAMRGVAL